MNLYLISVGTKMPRWIEEGFNEYAKRMPPEARLKLIEIPSGHRGKRSDLARAVRDEGDRMLKAVPRHCLVVALEIKGRPWTTEQLSGRLESWMSDGRDIAFMIGGPDGLADGCLRQAEIRWSLSPLTMPHPLVRVIVAEQLYRAWSLLRNHPYHRA